MGRNAKLIAATETQAWLSQFVPGDQETAERMLRRMLLVGRDAFEERLKALILKRMQAGPYPVGLFAERELRHWKGKPNRLFKESKTKIKRAFGLGPKPVEPTKAYDPTVGSEGLVARLISEVCKENKKKAFNHPGPDAIRRHKIRRLIVVTDFIGSGHRISTYLDAAWQVRSVRSWWSARKSAGVSFEVVAYSGTEKGLEKVRAHRCAPFVHIVAGCPSINSLPYEDRVRIRKLCIDYDPGNHDETLALGFDGTGALISFAHGAPNNVPRLLYKGSKNWVPLFPLRIASKLGYHFVAEENSLDEVTARLVELRQTQLARAKGIKSEKQSTRVMLLVLAAVARQPRQSEALSAKTGLTVSEVEATLTKALRHKWVNEDRRLTDAGQQQLIKARGVKLVNSALQFRPKEFYYPKSLRAPKPAI